ncbi:isoleucine--tRNA ligase, cytoplasmic [Planococcus citri]|uniref:isoleucine--tRNA ligase, cytoplasmic n=1 Tax=Planococcus citri TaxID=170843 RepID=UPI0031FA1137
MELVPETIDFPKSEETTLQFWNEIKAFEECMKRSKGKPRYSFYDGPPFATGLPHYGHILAGTIKDIVTRYAHQNGYYVERRFGWDCHGLPVEFEIDKKLNIRGPDDVAKMGIAAYNAECRKIVTRYAKDWETIITRLGRWIDFKNDYKTLYPWYMESIWWVFSELWNKGLVYRGVKVMPYSTACNTPLSNFESGQNYKEVVDPAVIVGFPLVKNPSVSLLAWTTTPWTLPSNLALCVNENLVYVKIKDLKKNKFFILMKARLDYVFKSEEEYQIMEEFLGFELKGEQYEPIFPYFAHVETAFKVLTDNYVSEESGTGIVHQAPYFGEDDYRVCLANGVITRDQKCMVCPVNASGCFVEPVSEFAGQYVKDADKNIIKKLKENGRLFSASTIKHNYPFCWRSDTPLIYKAVPSWFIRVEHLSGDLMKCNQETYWVPDFVKDKRFGNWLKEARDWAISRNRYWGTPMPLWMSEDGEEVVCVSSIAELSKLTGVTVKDLHRENVDDLEIPSVDPKKPKLRRVPEVFDCWFESGSMPYAQLHYPFEHRKEFPSLFPADFIAEGIDQTRGWFYTLLVISTALFNKPPFKNLIANGLILASDGQKMSKRKKNYPDPMEIVGKYGADALRLYLINSPVVRAENLRFKEEGVRDVLKDVFLPWYNAYRFLVQNVMVLNAERNIQIKFKGDELSPNIMDKWILSFTQSLLIFVRKEMAAYRLYTVVPRLIKFIDNLTNWYVRMNRKRFKGENGSKDCVNALSTLSNVLFTMVKIMAPFTPFLCELIYQNLKHLSYEEEKSVHFLMVPEPKLNMLEEEIERSVSKMQTVIELGRIIRDRKTIPVKYPLKEVVVIHNDPNSLEEIKVVKQYIMEELNVRTVTFSTDKEKYGISLRAEPDHKTLGIRLKSAFKDVMTDIKNLSDKQVQDFVNTGSIELRGHKLNREDLRIIFNCSGPTATQLSDQYEAHSDNDLLVLLNVTLDQEMQDEGMAREIINRIQKLRKKAHLVPTDQIYVHYSILPEKSDLDRVATEYCEFIENSIKSPFSKSKPQSKVIASEEQELKNAKFTITLSRREDAATVVPNCRYVNVVLNGIEPGYGKRGSSGSVFLENPIGENFLTIEALRKEIENLFGLYNRKVIIKNDQGSLLEDLDIDKLSTKTIFVEPYYGRKFVKQNVTNHNNGIVSSFKNVSFGDKKGCIFLENPVDNSLEINEDKISDLIRRIFSLKSPQKISVVNAGNSVNVKIL